MHNEFYALSRVCRSQGKNPIPQGGTGACVTCKQRTSWVLRLHSCRALSPQSHNLFINSKSEVLT
jgi:hypothetical protein